MSLRRHFALLFAAIVCRLFLSSPSLQPFQISLHYLITHFFATDKHISSSIRNLASENTTVLTSPPANPSATPAWNESIRANATFVVLCRNSDLNGVASSMQSIEDRFNKNYNYPWVLLNEQPFTEVFKQRISVLTRAPISFGVIPAHHWYQPDWIDENKAREGRLKMQAKGIIYAGQFPNYPASLTESLQAVFRTRWWSYYLHEQTDLPQVSQYVPF
jgi:hypothetical protein